MPFSAPEAQEKSVVSVKTLPGRPHRSPEGQQSRGVAPSSNGHLAMEVNDWLWIPNHSVGPPELVPGLDWGREPLNPFGTKQNCSTFSHAARWSLGWHPHLHWLFPFPLREPPQPIFPLSSPLLSPSSATSKTPPTFHFHSHHILADHPSCPHNNTSPLPAAKDGITDPFGEGHLIQPLVGIYSMSISPMSSYTTQSPQDTL